MSVNQSELDYYAKPRELTNLENHVDFVNWLSDDILAIYQTVQGLITHDGWISRYGFVAKDIQKGKKYTSISANQILKIVRSLRDDDLSFSIPRSPEETYLGSCREFTLLLTAILRAKGIPARGRCGFAYYLSKEGEFEDHWICEYWDGAKWVGVDAQIDPFQLSSLQNYARTAKDINADRKTMFLSLNPLHITNKNFFNAGIAWQRIRSGEADPEKFGIGADPEKFGLKSLFGEWFVRGQLLRDFGALNKEETVPFLVRLGKGKDWKSWELASKKEEDLTEGDILLLDKIADYCVNPDGRLEEITELYKTEPRLKVLL